MKTQELVTVEFRYYDAPNNKDSEYRTKIVTVGIFDTLDEAITEGNKALAVLAKTFQVRPDDWFKKNHLFGYPKRLATNTCYSTHGIHYFAKIEALKFEDLSEAISETIEAAVRYKKYKSEQNED